MAAEKAAGTLSLALLRTDNPCLSTEIVAVSKGKRDVFLQKPRDRPERGRIQGVRQSRISRQSEQQTTYATTVVPKISTVFKRAASTAGTIHAPTVELGQGGDRQAIV